MHSALRCALLQRVSAERLAEQTPLLCDVLYINGYPQSGWQSSINGALQPASARILIS